MKRMPPAVSFVPAGQGSVFAAGPVMAPNDRFPVLIVWPGSLAMGRQIAVAWKRYVVVP